MEDDLIIAHYWKREEVALEETRKKYGNYIYKIIKNILKSNEDTDECVNDTYFSIWNSIPPTKPISLLAYVGAIARNVSLSRFHYNTAQKRNIEFNILLSELENCLGTNESVESHVSYHELVDAINNFLYQQSENTRNIFIRRYWYADSISDIAKRFKTRDGTVKSTLSRTRIKLKLYLQKEGFEL